MKLKAVLLNCSLKKSPAVSNTQALMDIVIDHLTALDVDCETIRVVDYNVPFGVESDLGDGDEWPSILERLDGSYATTNDVGQYPMYNKVAGVVVTGNEDGAHAAAETTLFNLSHLGFTIPPNADTYWVGTAGPGPSFIEAGGAEHPYTLKTAGWMAHNVVHMARMLAEHPIPADGNTVPGTTPRGRGTLSVTGESQGPVHRLTRGRHTFASLVAGIPVLMLTTTGAKSGQPRTVPVLAIPAADGLAIIASNFGQDRHPGWYHNLRANPEADVVVDGARRRVRAVPVEGERRARIWQEGLRTYPGFDQYQRRASQRQISVFVLEPV